MHFNAIWNRISIELSFAGIGHQIGRFVPGQEFKKKQPCANRHVVCIGWLEHSKTNLFKVNSNMTKSIGLKRNNSKGKKRTAVGGVAATAAAAAATTEDIVDSPDSEDEEEEEARNMAIRSLGKRSFSGTQLIYVV